MYKALNVQAIAKPVSEVLPSLNTGIVTGFDNTPLFSLAARAVALAGATPLALEAAVLLHHAVGQLADPGCALCVRSLAAIALRSPRKYLYSWVRLPHPRLLQTSVVGKYSYFAMCS